MLEYWQGDANATYTIHRDDGFSHLIQVEAAFAGPPFSPLEQVALDRCRGSVLDVGGGAGRHSLWLQERGLQVTAIEVVPELVAIMSARGVAEPLEENLFSLAGRRFDTVLMLMNGLGLTGTLQGVETFCEHARSLLKAGGQVLCDSLDVRLTTDLVHLAYQQANMDRNLPAGQMCFWIEHAGRRGESFHWLHLDFETLHDLALRHGCAAEKLGQEENGHYLARITCGN